jgi:polysaccharide pyruvyl transferase WcaK-like protein
MKKIDENSTYKKRKKYANRKLVIGLIFHSAVNDNLGVGALTVSEMEIIRIICIKLEIKANIRIFDSISIKDPCVSGDDVTVIQTRPLRRPFHQILKIYECDIIVDIGGGDSLSDIYGFSRFARMHFIKYMVHLLGKPLVLAPQTIGPFKSIFARLIAGWSINHSALVATRDKQSINLLREMCIVRTVIEASDVALRLPYIRPDNTRTGQVPKVGLNVSGLLINGGYTRSNMFGLRMEYRELIRELVIAFLNHPDKCELHLVPHVIGAERGGIEDDYQACLDLGAQFKDVIVAPAFNTPSEAKGYIAGMDFFAGARMHACIAAFSSGVPVTPMAYSRKFGGLFNSLGYEYTVEMTIDDQAAVVRKIMSGYENRKKLAREAAIAFELGLDRLAKYESSVEELIKSAYFERN